jgi:hypothetical protein
MRAAAPMRDVATRLRLHLVGQVTGHPRHGAGKIITSQLWWADPDGMWVRTLTRFYGLGRPADPDGQNRILTSAMFTFDDRDRDDDGDWPGDYD